MRLILDPAENTMHGTWLRETPGAYEWWYFDALSESGEWAMSCIWFLGNPFSPYYRLAATGRPADPFADNALFFALYKEGRLYAYHFTTFPKGDIFADETRPASLRFGENTLQSQANGEYRLRLADENANRRQLTADLSFWSTPLLTPPRPNSGESIEERQDTHFWLPSAPACQVAASITLREAQNSSAESIAFTGHGYHDHNWGRLPFQADILEWYWARASLGKERAVILYHVITRSKPISQLLLFDRGKLIHYDDKARIKLGRTRMNGFGTLYATRLETESEEIQAVFHLENRLDSAPFYLRTLCRADVTISGKQQMGTGLGEYFRPHWLSSPVIASATKARIVER